LEVPQREVALPVPARPEALRLPAEWRVPLKAPRSVQLALPRQVRAQAARLDVRAGPRRGLGMRPAYGLVAAVPMVREPALAWRRAAERLVAQLQAEPLVGRLEAEPAEQGAPAQPRRAAQQVAVQPQAARVEVAGSVALVPEGQEAERGAAAEPQPAAGSAAAVLLLAEEVGPAVEAVPPRAAEEVPRQAAARAAGVPLPGEQAGAEPLQGARDAEAVRRRAVQGEAPAVRPLAVAWEAAHPCLQELARPAPSPGVRSGHAKGNSRIARL
jgi:hypothetical protein